MGISSAEPKMGRGNSLQYSHSAIYVFGIASTQRNFSNLDTLRQKEAVMCPDFMGRKHGI